MNPLAVELDEKVKPVSPFVLGNGKYSAAGNGYPLSLGVKCLQLKRVDAEQLRGYRLEKYGLAVTSIGKTDLPISLTCIAEENIQELFDLIRPAGQDLVEHCIKRKARLTAGRFVL